MQKLLKRKRRRRINTFVESEELSGLYANGFQVDGHPTGYEGKINSMFFFLLTQIDVLLKLEIVQSNTKPDPQVHEGKKQFLYFFISFTKKDTIYIFMKGTSVFSDCVG